ncbi:MAG: DUF2905 domain-containing protein [Bacillota bacterium]
MGAEFDGMGRNLIIIGVVLITVGVVMMSNLDVPLGRLPGDIKINREHFSFYLPITTSIILSIILSLILKLFK